MSEMTEEEQAQAHKYYEEVMGESYDEAKRRANEKLTQQLLERVGQNSASILGLLEPGLSELVRRVLKSELERRGVTIA